LTKKSFNKFYLIFFLWANIQLKPFKISDLGNVFSEDAGTRVVFSVQVQYLQMPFSFHLLNRPQEGEEQAGLAGLQAEKEGPARGQQAEASRTSRRTQ
jgi:hypothetical protein